MMRPREASNAWDRSRARLREWAAAHTPHALTNFPFEVLAGVVALLMGVPFLLTGIGPVSLVSLVGPVAFGFWAAALAIGGVTLLAGLRLPQRPNAMIVAAGLQLVGGCYLVYALAAVVAIGVPAWTAFIAFGLLALLSMIRATHFRRIVDIQKGASRLRAIQEDRP